MNELCVVMYQYSILPKQIDIDKKIKQSFIYWFTVKIFVFTFFTEWNIFRVRKCFFPKSQLIFNFLTSSNFFDPILATAKSIRIVLSKEVTIPFATFCITWSTLLEFRTFVPKRGTLWDKINLHDQIAI